MPIRRNATSKRDAQLASIARRRLGFETLETRNAGDYDFREVAVWSVEAALNEAYDLGQASGVTAGLRAASRGTKANPRRRTAGRRNPAKTHSTGLAQRYGVIKVGQAVDIRIDSFSALTLRVTGVASMYGEIEVTGTVLEAGMTRRHVLAKVPKVGDVVTVPLEAVDSYFIIPRG